MRKLQNVRLEQLGTVENFIKSVKMNNAREDVLIHLVSDIDNQFITINLSHCRPSAKVNELFRLHAEPIAIQNLIGSQIKGVTHKMGYRCMIETVSSEYTVSTVNQIPLGMGLSINPEALRFPYQGNSVPISKFERKPFSLSPDSNAQFLPFEDKLVLQERQKDFCSRYSLFLSESEFKAVIDNRTEFAGVMPYETYEKNFLIEKNLLIDQSNFQLVEDYFAIQDKKEDQPVKLDHKRTPSIFSEHTQLNQPEPIRDNKMSGPSSNITAGSNVDYGSMYDGIQDNLIHGKSL